MMMRHDYDLVLETLYVYYEHEHMDMDMTNDE